ncbi:MAG TPA: toprim domain-containing protein [Devosia sp.]|nr:toprim domain-containing protein [Devosia sp.]
MLTNKGTECPVCGGKDRFRFDDKDGKGTWFCNQSHGTETDNPNGCAGNGFALLMDLKRCDFAEAARLIETVIGTDSAPQAPAPTQLQAEAASNHAEVMALWKAARPIQQDDIADIYLRSRLGDYPASRALRFHDALPYGSRHVSGMLSAYVDQHGDLSGLQRTFLTPGGRKIEWGEPRLTMGNLPGGGAVRLVRLEPRHTGLGIAEGVETAMSVAAMFGMPCWAALNAGRMAVWEPPEGISSIVIFADHDANKRGQQAAFTLAARLEQRGIVTDVQIPPDVGTDWNDVHQMKMRGQ